MKQNAYTTGTTIYVVKGRAKGITFTIMEANDETVTLGTEDGPVTLSRKDADLVIGYAIGAGIWSLSPDECPATCPENAV